MAPRSGKLWQHLRAGRVQACKYIEEHLSIDTASLGKETLLNAAKTAMSSKIVDSESDFFAHMVVDAVQVRATSLHVSTCAPDSALTLR